MQEFIKDKFYLEPLFKEHYFGKNIWAFRFCILMAILFLISWFRIDYLYFYPNFKQFIIIKIVMILFLLMGFAYSYRKSYIKNEELIASGFVLMIGFGFCTMMKTSSTSFIFPLIFALVFVLFFNYAFAPIRFALSSMNGILIYAAAILVLYSLRKYHDPRTIHSSAYFLFMLNLFGMMISYTIENSHKKEFYLLNKLNNEKDNQISKMEDKLYIEPLTGLYNRFAMDRFLPDQVNQIRKQGIESSLCYVDLDRLKYVNDNFGHKVGDAYISTLADVLKDSIRDGDMGFRIGGDEFLVYLHNCCRAEPIIKRILKKYEESTKKLFNEFSGSFSYGIVPVSEDKNETMAELISSADEIMFMNKKNKGAERESPINF